MPKSNAFRLYSHKWRRDHHSTREGAKLLLSCSFPQATLQLFLLCRHSGLAAPYNEAVVNGSKIVCIHLIEHLAVHPIYFLLGSDAGLDQERLVKLEC